jgi:HD-like signal output (HDOD) protein
MNPQVRAEKHRVISSRLQVAVVCPAKHTWLLMTCTAVAAAAATISTTVGPGKCKILTLLLNLLIVACRHALHLWAELLQHERIPDRAPDGCNTGAPATHSYPGL